MAKRLEDYLNYQKYFNPTDLWNKIAYVARKAGVKVVYAVLLLYYVATDPKTSTADKAKIYGALGYFILPMDLMPDMMPMLGYSDDLAALVWALKAVWNNITPDIHAKAREQLGKWFKNVEDSELKIF